MGAFNSAIRSLLQASSRLNNQIARLGQLVLLWLLLWTDFISTSRTPRLPQPLTSHPIPIAIQVAVPLPQQLLGLGKRADLLAGGHGPAGLDCLRASDGRA